MALTDLKRTAVQPTDAGRNYGRERVGSERIGCERSRASTCGEGTLSRPLGTRPIPNNRWNVVRRSGGGLPFDPPRDLRTAGLHR